MKLLEGIRVLDLSRLLPGPVATAMLGDMGADVIKVEEPKIGDYLGSITFNRNKRSAAIDFRTDAGREAVYDLARSCDAVVEGARPGALAKFGLGYEQIRAVNPRIVYCSVTGFGQTGPFASFATHGGAYDAVTGMAPPRELDDGSFVQYRPFPHAFLHGSWLAAMSVCAALLKAARTGEGTYLDISCSDAALMCLAQEMDPVLAGTRDGFGTPEEHIWVKYCYYKTKDDRFMLIQALEKHFWAHFCDVVGRPDLAGRGDWSANQMDFGTGDMELRAALIDIFRSKTQAEWTRIFIENDVAGAPYYPLNEVADTELFRSREMIVEEDHPAAGKRRMVANAIKIPGDPFELRRHAPLRGEHTREILREIGYDDQRIAALESDGTAVQR